jgi:hypothetical protein
MGAPDFERYIFRARRHSGLIVTGSRIGYTDGAM